MTQLTLTETELIAQMLASALAGCSARLQFTLGQLSGSEFTGEAPSALQNIHDTTTALAAWENHTSGKAHRAQPFTATLRRAASTLDSAKLSLVVAGHPDTELANRITALRDQLLNAAAAFDTKEAA